MTALDAVHVAHYVPALAYLGVVAWRATSALRRVAEHPERRESSRGALGAEPSVTLVQPILGGDPRLAEVLGETLARTPAWARFLWLVDEGDAAGHAATAPLAMADPRVAVVVCEPPRLDENPKVKKLLLGAARVTTTFLAVLDDDTVVGEANLVAALDVLGGLDAPSRAELYTGLPSYDLGDGLPSRLLAQFVNDGAPSTYLSLQAFFGALSLNGMFYVTRSAPLRASGALDAIRGAVCDDYALARELRSRGWRIHQGWTAMRLSTSVPSLAAYARQMHRWFVFALVLVRDQPLSRRAALLALLAAPPLTLAAALGAASRGLGPTIAAALVLLARQFALTLVARRVLGTRPGGAPGAAPVASVLAELVQPLHAVHAMCVSTVRWRSRRVRVGPGGTYCELGGGAH